MAAKQKANAAFAEQIREAAIREKEEAEAEEQRKADLAARDELQTCVNAQVFVLVTMLALDVWWIPLHGANGAALASTVAYVAGTVWTVVAYSRQTDIAAWRCLFVHPSDFGYIRDIFAAVIRKLRRKD